MPGLAFSAWHDSCFVKMHRELLPTLAVSTPEGVSDDKAVSGPQLYHCFRIVFCIKEEEKTTNDIKRLGNS